MTPRHVVRAVALAVVWLAAHASAVDAKLRVVATLPDLAALASAIGGDRVEVTSIGRPNEDPHYIQAKPSFIVALNKADVLIQNGLDLEAGWLPALVDQTRNGKIRAGSAGLVTAADGVPVLGVPTGPVTRAMGDVHPGGNPHFLLDPENAKIVARNIAGALSGADPEGASVFADNLARLVTKIDEALAACLATIAPHRGTKVVTYHTSLAYFCRRFGLVESGTIEPKPGIPPSPSHLADLIARMKAEDVKLILMEPWHERRTPDLVAKQTGAVVVDFGAQVGAGPDVPDYPSLCGSITRKIVEALPK